MTEEDRACVTWSKTHLALQGHKLIGAKTPQTHWCNLGLESMSGPASLSHGMKGPCYAGTSLPREQVNGWLVEPDL